MPESQPPTSPPVPLGWGKDALLEFLQAARRNQLATFANKGDRYRRLAAIDELFVRVSKQWTNPKDPLAALLFLRCHSAFRAACGLAMAGQMAEASAMHRLCLEYAGYALHINRNPSLGLLWLDRHQDDGTLRKVQSRNSRSRTSARPLPGATGMPPSGSTRFIGRQ